MVDFLHEDLIRKAIKAARAGDRATALENVKEVLEEDDQNSRAWMLLARISSDLEEKQMALENVLELDPDNEKAQALLDKLVAKMKKPSSEVIPGVSRRDLTIAGGVVAGVILLLAFIFFVISTMNSNKEATDARNVRDQNATQVRLVQVMTENAQTAVAESLHATQTQIARASPTPLPTNTSNAPTLPPSHTPQPEVVETGPDILPQLAGVTGIISGWSGLDMTNVDALPLVTYTLNGEAALVAPQVIGEEQGRQAIIAPNGLEMIYTQFIRRNNRLDVKLIGMEGEPLPSNLETASNLGRFNNSFMPNMSVDGSMVVFIGESFTTGTNEVYLVVLFDTMQTTPLFLTSDQSNYSYPAFSPDGAKVVAVRENPSSAENPGPDLVVIDVQSRTYSALTNNNAEMIESMPRWSPDGSLIAFVAATADKPEEGDIYVIPPGNTGSGILALDDPTNAVWPVYSPDGQYLAFSSNRNGNYDIYIFDLVGHETYQLTNTRDEDYPANWIAMPGEENTEGE
jgi:hypothetical protein